MLQQRPDAFFLADASGLDFLNSVANPAGAPVDWIDDGDGFLAWLEQARLVPSKTLAALKAQLSPAELDQVAEQARQLREWFRRFVQTHKGKPLAAADLKELERLNQLLDQDEQFQRIVKTDPGSHDAFALHTDRRWRTAESLLLPIGEAMAKLVCEEDFSYVKACEGQQCTMLFADHTRGRARRWCSMAICGNRAKVAAHRQRQKGQP